MALDPEFLKTWTRNGHIIPVGENYQRLEYARTLEIIADDPMALYEGEIGEAIAKAIQDRGGLMTKQDLIGEWDVTLGHDRAWSETEHRTPGFKEASHDRRSGSKTEHTLPDVPAPTRKARV